MYVGTRVVYNYSLAWQLVSSLSEVVDLIDHIVVQCLFTLQQQQAAAVEAAVCQYCTMQDGSARFKVTCACRTLYVYRCIWLRQPFHVHTQRMPTHSMQAKAHYNKSCTARPLLMLLNNISKVTAVTLLL
jgi:hypothetical protein